MADDERSMRDIMEEVYDRMTSDEPEEGVPSYFVFSGLEEDEEARARAARV